MVRMKETQSPKRTDVHGTVKWFNKEKGYGFITEHKADKDIFVHFSGINSNGFRTLENGQNVTYDIIDGLRGEQAVNVK